MFVIEFQWITLKFISNLELLTGSLACLPGAGDTFWPSVSIRAEKKSYATMPFASARCHPLWKSSIILFLSTLMKKHPPGVSRNTFRQGILLSAVYIFMRKYDSLLAGFRSTLNAALDPAVWLPAFCPNSFEHFGRSNPGDPR